MPENRPHVYEAWRESLPDSLPNAVSLHSHTSRSKESMSFIPRYVEGVPLLGGRIRRLEQQYLKHHGHPFDYARVWWTPPLEPKAAFDLERKQIEHDLGRPAMVSLSDHDSIDAGFALEMFSDCAGAPISSEWTVPIEPSFVHVGVHNLQPARARMLERAMAEATASPDAACISEMLDELSRDPQTLVVLNHPLWDEAKMGAAVHREMVLRFLTLHRRYIHALELNGLRPKSENLEVIELAKTFGLPVVSGGDRHGCEPNAVLNLTRAASFGEFAAEIRDGATSHVVYMPQYRESIRLRHIQVISDVLRTYDEFDTERRLWSDRIFYLCEDATIQRLSNVWKGNGPDIVGQFVTAMQLFQSRHLRAVLRMAITG